jgi:monofunctional biosynthetic peptidoglycan transglycosylase
VVASEDQLFPTHSGFDFKQIHKALDDAERGRRARGASTISQQVAKNLFLWNGHSWVRKGFEAWFTVLIEWLWPKQRILEMYLNIAQFGRGIYGAEAAAQNFFHKPAARLTQAEAARLAAVLPNPLQLRAERPSRYLQRRQLEIEQQMRALGGPSYLAGM